MFLCLSVIQGIHRGFHDVTSCGNPLPKDGTPLLRMVPLVRMAPPDKDGTPSAKDGTPRDSTPSAKDNTPFAKDGTP